MNKWIALLCAGVLMSAVMVGCKKAEEGDTSGTTSTSSDKSDMKSGTGTAEDAKVDGSTKTGESGGEMKTGEGK